MEAIKARVWVKGSLPSFVDYIRNDPKFKPASAQALGDGYRAIGKRVAIALPKLFSSIPKTPPEIRPVPAYNEKTSAGAYYMQGTTDGTRPGGLIGRASGGARCVSKDRSRWAPAHDKKHEIQ